MSKGLKLVEELKQYIYPESKIYKKLSIIEKELKALEILKEKLIDINWLNGCEELGDYNDLNEPTLEQEEYNLLKEVLKWVITLY